MRYVNSKHVSDVDVDAALCSTDVTEGLTLAFCRSSTSHGPEEQGARSETRTIRGPEVHVAGNLQEERPGREDAGLVSAAQERVLRVYGGRLVEGQAHSK